MTNDNWAIGVRVRMGGRHWPRWVQWPMHSNGHLPTVYIYTSILYSSLVAYSGEISNQRGDDTLRPLPPPSLLHARRKEFEEKSGKSLRKPHSGQGTHSVSSHSSLNEFMYGECRNQNAPSWLVADAGDGQGMAQSTIREGRMCGE